jgi:hypothetical protein
LTADVYDSALSGAAAAGNTANRLAIANDVTTKLTTLLDFIFFSSVFERKLHINEWFSEEKLPVTSFAVIITWYSANGSMYLDGANNGLDWCALLVY